MKPHRRLNPASTWMIKMTYLLAILGSWDVIRSYIVLNVAYRPQYFPFGLQ